MRFDKLVVTIQDAHDGLQHAAIKAVNQSLTIRNWLIGLYIVEFEQHGEDRAKYGERLLSDLPTSVKIKGLSETNLRLCRQFYTSYPHLFLTIKATLEQLGLQAGRIGQSLTDQLQITDNQHNEIHQSATDELKQDQPADFKSDDKQLVVPEHPPSKLSFTHIVQLLPIQNTAKRTFYERECIRQAWSVSELKRQIRTLYYERSGISKRPKDMFFSESFDEPSINIIATKSVTRKSGINYKGTGTFNGKQIDIESYSIPEVPSYDITDEDQEIVSALLDRWLRDGYFVNGVTGYALYQDLLAKQAAGEIELPDSFRPILVARAIITMCNRRKKPKLLPQRKLPKTPEKWLLYKEDW